MDNLHILTPWLMGGLTLTVLGQSPQKKIGENFMLFGAGGWFGYLVCAIVSQLAVLILVLAALTAFVYLIRNRMRQNGACESSRVNTTATSCGINVPSSRLYLIDSAVTVSVFALICVVVMIGVYQSIAAPAQSWDGLSYWLAAAKNELQPLPSIIARQVQEIGGRHPTAVVQVAASSAAEVAGDQWYSPALAPWLAIWISLLLCTYGFARWLSCSKMESLIVTLVMASVPILENHGLLAGYSELWLLCGVVIGLTSIVVYKTTLDHAYLVIAIFAMALSLEIRNTSGIYIGIMIFAAFLSLLVTRVNVRWIGPLVVTSWLSTVFIIKVFLKTIVALTAIKDIDPFHHAGRELAVVDTSLITIIGSLVSAIVSGASFSVLLTAALVISFFTFENDERQKKTKSTAFLIIYVLLGMLMITISQFTEYGATVSAAGSDTGFSRYHIPIVPIVVLAAASALPVARMLIHPKQ